MLLCECFPNIHMGDIRRVVIANTLRDLYFDSHVQSDPNMKSNLLKQSNDLNEVQQIDDDTLTSLIHTLLNERTANKVGDQLYQNGDNFRHTSFKFRQRDEDTDDKIYNPEYPQELSLMHEDRTINDDKRASKSQKSSDDKRRRRSFLFRLRDVTSGDMTFGAHIGPCDPSFDGYCMNGGTCLRFEALDIATCR